jgi:hypothetical protein
MNLPGIVAGQNGVLVLKIVRQSTIKAEAFGYPFIMVVLVLQPFGSRKVYWGRAIIATVCTSVVAHCVGSRWGCLGGSQVGIIRAVREGSIGLDLVVTFYA